MLAILAVNMAAGSTKKVEEVVEIRVDPKQIAVYPLAVPYLLNQWAGLMSGALKVSGQT